MILHGRKKRILKDLVCFYVETTDKAYEDFIMGIQKEQGKISEGMSNENWLAVKCYEILQKEGIDLADCIENKDVIRSAISADKSRNDGEFYTPKIWCDDGRKYLKEMLGDKWGKANIWDASCYSMDTEILTHRGWMTYDNLRDDDYVYSLNPDTLQGEFVRFYNRFKKTVNEQMVNFKGQSIDLLVTQDHSMFTKKAHRGGTYHDYEFRTARDMYYYLKETPSRERRLSIQLGARLKGTFKSENFDTQKGLFWQLFGFYLGNGFLIWSRVKGKFNKIRFSIQKERKIEYLTNLLNTLGLEYTVNDYMNYGKPIMCFNVYCDELIDFIVKHWLTDAKSKHIPFSEIELDYYYDLYLGLLNSGGSENSYGAIDYVSISSQLCEDFGLLLTTLGYVVSFSNKKGVENTLYRVRGNSKQITNLSYDSVTLQDYIGDVWDITLDKNHVFLVRRNGKQVFSGNCGTGNLLRDSDYPADKMFMSTLLQEDIDMIKDDFKGSTLFQCDFVNGIDWDEYNMDFSTKLPENLRKVLENNEPLVFLMNPPYKVMAGNISDVGAYMGSPAIGMAKCALDIFHQFMYRILMLKRFYKLTDVYLGIFGPITMFHSDMLKPLYEDFKKEFIFDDGMCFAAGDFSNTSESVGWIVGYTCWRSKTEQEKIANAENPVLLTAKRANQDNEISVVGQRLIRNVDVNLHNWAFPDLASTESLHMVKPAITNMFNFTGENLPTLTASIGYMMSSNFVIRATRRACCTSIPIPDGIEITEENFWRCVASYCARRCYYTDSNPYNNCQYYSKPDESVEGYDQWLVDALAIFLFEFNSQFASYRDVEQDGVSYKVLQNRMFPLSVGNIRQYITDENILADLDNSIVQDNEFIVKLLAECHPKMSREAQELCEFAIQTIVESLQGDARKNCGYANHTVSWDAGLVQIRSVPELWSTEKEERYSYLIARLKDKLIGGIYKYGFMMDVDYSDDTDSEEESDNE